MNETGWRRGELFNSQNILEPIMKNRTWFISANKQLPTLFAGQPEKDQNPDDIIYTQDYRSVSSLSSQFK